MKCANTENLLCKYYFLVVSNDTNWYVKYCECAESHISISSSFDTLMLLLNKSVKLTLLNKKKVFFLPPKNWILEKNFDTL